MLPLPIGAGYVIIFSDVPGPEARFLEAIEIAQRAVDIGSQKQADDIVLLDSRQACSFTDYIVILTAESTRQINAIREEIVHSLKKSGVYPKHVEGDAQSGWVLMDYIDTIIHIFAPAERDYYRLDTVWPNMSPVVNIQ